MNPLLPNDADKIAIIGSAVSSVALAPYRDPKWAIWGCSPGAYGAAARKDVWFEQHRWEPQEPGFPTDPHAKPWFSPEYVRFLELFEGPVFMSHKVPTVKNCTIYPYDLMIAKHGPYHFTSSVAWMLALAIEQQPKAIGLWGIDMAASEEYALQRPGCQHFLGLAIRMGIEVVLPPESDLMQPSTMYGLCEINPRHVKWTIRKRELELRRNALQGQQQGLAGEIAYLSGAISNMEYMLAHWVDLDDPMLDAAVSRSAALVGREETIPSPMVMGQDAQLMNVREFGLPEVPGARRMMSRDEMKEIIRQGSTLGSTSVAALNGDARGTGTIGKP